jgi:transposase
MGGESFHLDKKDRQVLEEFHRVCLDKKTADRIKAILLMDDGFTVTEIERILLLDERTLYRYKKIYINRGIDGLVEGNYQGGFYKLTDEQLTELKGILNSRLFSTAAEVCHYVWKTFRVRYTPAGMVKTLHRLGYSYKRTVPVPGKADSDKQKAFIERYEQQFKSLPDNEKVLFLDGSHPTFNNDPGYAWIRTGSNRCMKTHDGRKHLNLMGAYDPKNQAVFVKNYQTLNQDSVLDFLKSLKGKYPGKLLHIIWDNVPYQHAREVTKFAQEAGIDLVYLPAYSPNLNLIERYWGFLRKYVLRNKYYETFAIFQKAVIRFSRNESTTIKMKLNSYIPERFYILPEPSG